MASRRMIDPAFWQSETMAPLTCRQRLLFIGLFSNADDQGRLKAHPGLVRAQVFPFDEISHDDIISELDAIEETGSICTYVVDGRRFIQIVNWWEYQSPQWAYPSRIPSPDRWKDRLRYKKDKKEQRQNWEGVGGFNGDDARPEPIPEIKPEPEPCIESVTLAISLAEPTAKDSGSPIVEFRDRIDNNGASASASPKKPPRDPPAGVLLPDTEASKILMRRLTIEARAKGRRGPKKFPSLACKQKFDTAAERLGDEIESAIKRACEVGALSVPKATDYVAKWNVGPNKPKGGTVEHRAGKRRAKVGN